MTLPDNPNPFQGTGDEPAQEKTRPEIPFPEAPSLPEGFTPLVRSSDLNTSSRARRRRARRALTLPNISDRGSQVEDLAHRSIPSLEFFLLAFLSGILLGAGYLLDAHALLLLGLLVSPLMTPWVGMTLAVVSGSGRFFLQTLASLLIAFMLVFVTSGLVGLAGRMFPALPLFNADIHTHLWWPDLLIVMVGAVLLVLAFLGSKHRAILPSLMLAYGLLLPVSAAGFGLGIEKTPVWPDGILVFLTHFSLATLVGMITLGFLKYKPQKSIGAIFSILIGLICIAALVVLTGLAGWVMIRIEAPQPDFNPTPLGLASPTPGLPPSATPGAPTQTASLSPSETSIPTATSTPAPSYAVIQASTGGGALVRTEPGGGDVITTLINGTLVEVLPEIKTVVTTSWARIRTEDGSVGWVLQAVLVAATPAPTSSQASASSPTP